VETIRGETGKGMRDGGWARGFTAFSKRIVEALRAGRRASKALPHLRWLSHATRTGPREKGA